MELEYIVCPNCQEEATFLYNPETDIGWCSQCSFHNSLVNQTFEQ